MKGIISINGIVSKLYFDYDNNKTVNQKANEFNGFKEEALKKNDEIMNKLIGVIQKNYKI